MGLVSSRRRHQERGILRSGRSVSTNVLSPGIWGHDRNRGSNRNRDCIRFLLVFVKCLLPCTPAAKRSRPR